MDRTQEIRTITDGATCAPTPNWVDLEPYEIPAVPNPHFVGNGLCVLLDDSQIDLTGEERAWFYRRADLIIAHSGAERAAQVSTSFDPSYERLEVHSIAVIRAGVRTEHARTAFFEVLRRERNMERLVFDGHLTIHVTLPDVRVGDVVEVSYTLYGQRKSLGGKFAAWVPQEWGLGILETRLRLLAPQDRPIAEHGVNNPPIATVHESDGVIEKRWRTRERPGIRFEQLTPTWIAENAAIQFSEWRSWSEVAEQFAPLYEEPGPLPPAFADEVARIAAAYATPAERAGAILRFTQSAVRYLAIAIGEGGFTPRPLADIDATRYGDCKDKAKLFVAMARALGLDACPVLVNTTSGYGLDTWLPSAVVFDHCIVRVEIDGAPYWLDGTRALQHSPLDRVGPSSLGYSLPLKPQGTLERIPDPTPVHFLETREHIRIGASPHDPVRYEMRFTSRRGRAEMVREYFQREGEVGAFKSYADSVRRTWPKAKPVRQFVDRDDHALNEIVIDEAYEIEDAWSRAPGTLFSYQFSTLDLTMKQTFAPLDPGERKHPIYLGAIGKVSRRVDIETKHELVASGWNVTLECSALSYRTVLRKEGPLSLVLEQVIDIRAMTLPAEEAEQYRAIVAELEKSDIVLTETVNKRARFIRSRPNQQARGGGIGWIGWAVGAALGAGYLAWRILGANP